MYSANVAKSNNFLEGVHCKVQKGTEIRRFLLKVADISHLKSHLQVLFSFQDNDFVVKYHDEEDDMITISSNDDLTIALMIIKGSVLRLVVITVGDEARSAVKGVERRQRRRSEDRNLDKKESDEFLCGKGRKFAKKEWKREKWGRYAEMHANPSKCESNEPQFVAPAPAPVPTPSEDGEADGQFAEFKSKLLAAKEKVLNLKINMRTLRNDSTVPEDKIKEAKEELINAKSELFALRMQFREMKMSKRQSKCAERMKWKAEREEKKAHHCHGRQMKNQACANKNDCY